MIDKHFKDLLDSLENYFQRMICDEESMENTPNRLAKMYTKELLKGYNENPTEILSKVFQSKSNDLVIIKDIPFVSLCSHHWLPFIGKAHVGYIPKNNKVVGLSKIPRLVECYARRFQIQENMTTEIADSLYKELTPAGCIVITEAQHLCAQIRGVQSLGTIMTCSAIRGDFENNEVRSEFLRLIGHGA